MHVISSYNYVSERLKANYFHLIIQPKVEIFLAKMSKYGSGENMEVYLWTPAFGRAL